MKAYAAVLGSVLLTGCSVVGVRAATEQPKYSVLDRINGDIEIRRYQTRTVAEVEIETATGAKAAARPFASSPATSSAEPAEAKVAMTAPVETQRTSRRSQ